MHKHQTNQKTYTLFIERQMVSFFEKKNIKYQPRENSSTRPTSDEEIGYLGQELSDTSKPEKFDGESQLMKRSPRDKEISNDVFPVEMHCYSIGR